MENYTELKNNLNIDRQEIEHGLELHKKFIVCDSLCEDPWPFTNKMVEKANKMLNANRPREEIFRTLGLGFGGYVGLLQAELVENPEARMEYMDSWKKSGVTCISSGDPPLNLEHAYRIIAVRHLKFNIFDGFLVKATKVEDIRRAKIEGKHAIILGFQRTMWLGGYHNLEAELDRINTFYNLGVREMQLTYNLQNLVGCGCTERHDCGLTHFGVKVVERMNNVGMLVDVSHCGHQTTLDTVEVSNAPIAATHNTCSAVYDYPRGKKDDEIQAIAEKGGYIGITGVQSFTVHFPKIGNLTDWLDHIDHAIDLVGADNIGLSSDHSHRTRYDRLWNYQREQGAADRGGWWTGFRPEHHTSRAPYPPKDEDLMSWDNWPNVTIGLVSRGYSDQEIKKVIGGSFLKLIERVIG